MCLCRYNMTGHRKTVDYFGIFLFCAILCTTSSKVDSDSFRDVPSSNNASNNNWTVAKIGMQFIAANVLELHWGADTLIAKDGLNLRNVTNIDVEVGDYGNSSILFVILVDGNCNASVVLNRCFLKILETCTFWNLEPSHSYTVCVRSWTSEATIQVENAAENNLFEWIPVFMRTEFRQPPMITRCTAEIVNGDFKIVEDAHRVIEIPYLIKDEITISCIVTGYPIPKIFWCKNRFDCNISSMNTTQIIDADGFKMSVAIKSASQHDEGLFYCVAENQYGRSMTSAFHLQFMEIAQFPDGDSLTKTVEIGGTAQLECSYPQHNQKFKYSWSKIRHIRDPEPEPVVNSDRIILGLDGSLIFIYIRPEDSGSYQCNVQNLKLETKTVSGSVSTLEIKDVNAVLFNRPPSLLKLFPNVMSALVGETIMLQCVFSGMPIPVVYWEGIPDVGCELSDNGTVLIIQNIQLLRQNKFCCWANNSEGRSKDFCIPVVLNEAPRFIRRPVSRNITVYETAMFYCQAAGNPQPQVQWLINGNVIRGVDSTMSLNYTLSEKLDILTVHKVTHLVAFNIQCNISNVYGYQLSNAYLNVFLPTQIRKPPDDVILSGQPSVIFSCEVQADVSTPVTITWMRGKKEIIYDDQRIYLLPNHSLVLNMTNEEDGGNSFVARYTCIASNGMNNDSRWANLRPAKVPQSTRKYGNNAAFPDMLWLGVICGVICLVIIATTIMCIVHNHPRHVKDRVTDSKDPRVESPWKQESFKMARRSKPNPGGRILTADNHICFDFHSIEKAQVHSALEQMYIPRERLRLGNCIGRGQFGRVFSAYLCHARDKIEEHVAVKTMKYKPEETEMAELFLREALLMKDFWHAHVLGVIGVTFDPDGSPMVILPFMANGDLRKYIMSTELDITVMQLLKMSLQVAYGMTYLSSMRFVHRDLAARNCMVDERGVVKVADFGLSRELILCDYYRLSNNKTPVPVRWMAPECLEANVFTTMSDVWSFGVLLWELVTRGAVPFSDLENWEVAGYIQSGKRLPQPLYCPDSVYFIMLNCWQEESHSRPTFEQITHDVEKIIRSAQALSVNGTSPVTIGSSVYSNTQLLINES